MARRSGVHSRAARVMAVVAVLATAALPAAAQTRGATRPAAKAADDKVVGLTEANWTKFLRATENIYALQNLDTASMDADDEDDGDDGTTLQTAASMAAKIDRIPPLRRAITSAGMTTTEYAEVQVAIIVAGFQMMADSLAKMYPGAATPAPAADPMTSANVAFLNRHAKDLHHLQALEDARKAKAKEADEEETKEPEEPAEEEPAGR
jgi:hypothetical protein